MRTLIYNDTEILAVITTQCKATLLANIGTDKSMTVDDSFDVLAHEVVGGSVVKRTNKNPVELYQERQIAIAAIEITTASGNTFKGDEKSQNRMLNKITEMQILGLSAVEWKCMNGVVLVDLLELKEALALASQALSNIVLGVK